MEIDITSKPGSTAKNKTGGWRTFKPKVDKKKCIGCGRCEKVCPEGVITIKESKAKINYSYCKGCGLCAAECPVGAIKMELEEK
jgi:2-oxoacid:acceptor oxidoreductase delta subunit (pyruvate/2-ketoisovalerate family)